MFKKNRYFLAKLRIDFPLTIGYFLGWVTGDLLKASFCFLRLIIGVSASFYRRLRGVLTILRAFGKASIAVSIFLVMLGPVAAHAFSYDELILMVKAEKSVFGAANYSQSLDQRLKALETKVFGQVSQGSDSYRLRAICRQIGLENESGQIVGPAEVTVDDSSNTSSEPPGSVPVSQGLPQQNGADANNTSAKQERERGLSRHKPEPEPDLQANEREQTRVSAEPEKVSPAPESPSPSNDGDAEQVPAEPAVSDYPEQSDTGYLADNEQTNANQQIAVPPTSEGKNRIQALEQKGETPTAVEKSANARSAFGNAVAGGVFAIIAVCSAALMYLILKSQEDQTMAHRRRLIQDNFAEKQFETYKEARSRRPVQLEQMEASSFHLHSAAISPDAHFAKPSHIADEASELRAEQMHLAQVYFLDQEPIIEAQKLDLLEQLPLVGEPVRDPSVNEKSVLSGDGREDYRPVQNELDGLDCLSIISMSGTELASETKLDSELDSEELLRACLEERHQERLEQIAEEGKIQETVCCADVVDTAVNPFMWSELKIEQLLQTPSIDLDFSIAETNTTGACAGETAETAPNALDTLSFLESFVSLEKDETEPAQNVPEWPSFEPTVPPSLITIDGYRSKRRKLESAFAPAGRSKQEQDELVILDTGFNKSWQQEEYHLLAQLLIAAADAESAKPDAAEPELNSSKDGSHNEKLRNLFSEKTVA